jgi:dATP pyrophosphohydrolase
VRAPYNTLVLPYCKTNEGIRYCIFARSDMKIWQFVAGGGEDNEAPSIAAKRELYEETGVTVDEATELTSMTYVPTFYFSQESREAWGIEKSVIPVFCFAAEIASDSVVLSHEHMQYQCVDYQTAVDLLHFDIDKTAVWELSERLRCKP